MNIKNQHNYRIVLFTLLILVSTSFVTSCSKEFGNGAGDGVAISFNSSLDTKALINDADDMTAFQVYGYYNTASNASVYTAFDGDVVSRYGDVWSYSPSRFWVKGAQYSFAAFHPADAQVNIHNYNMDSDGRFTGLSFEYEKTGFQDDFMLAVNAVTSDEATSEDNFSVDLGFNHILANIKLKIGLANNVQDGSYFRLLSVTLNGMKKSATYTLGEGWSDFSTTALQFSGNISDVLLNKKGGNVYNNSTLLTDGCINPTGEDGLTVIPVDLTDQNNILTLRLTCEVSNDGINYVQKIIEKRFIATQNVTAWEEGKSYTYKALLDMDYTISFSEPTITDWVDEQVTGSVIIK